MATALIADADDASRARRARAARRAGYTVCEASDGLEALALCRALRPAIAFFDPLLPQITGRELVQTLRFDIVFGGLPPMEMIVGSGPAGGLPWALARA